MRKHFFLFFVSIVMVLSWNVSLVQAQTPPISVRCQGIFASGISSVQDLIVSSGCVIQGAVKVLVPIALLIFLWGLAKFMLIAGDEEGRNQGKRIMIWGVVTLFIIVSVWGIVALLQSNLGINNVTFAP